MPEPHVDQRTRELIRATVQETMNRAVFVDHDARGAIRDLKQIFESHERLHGEAAKIMELSTNHADEQRQRIETKLDEFIEQQEQKDRRQLVGLLTLLIAALAFFLVPFFNR